MKIFGFVGRVAKPFVDVPRWIGAKRLIQDGKYVKDIAQNVFTPEKSKNSESFDQAMSRLNLTEHDIQARKKQCGLLANIFCSVSILLFAYMIYQITQGHVYASIACFIISGVALAQAIRNHFWVYQISQRRLGCSLNEWFKSLFTKGDVK